MRVVFFGTPDVAVPGLQAVLESSHEVVAAVTQPDKARGRGRTVSASPVKELALAHGLPVLQPASPKQPGFAAELAACNPGVCAVIAYGHILPPDVLGVAPAMNVHFSLLPRYRGAAPVQRALMDGATRTGISVFLLEPTVDTGPVVLREAIDIGPEETTGEVLARLAPLGARMLVRALDALAAGTLQPEPQGDEAATPAPKIRAEETVMDWTWSARDLSNLVRALNPRPGASTIFRGKRLGIWRARLAEAVADPGVILGSGNDLLAVGTGRGALELLEVQPEGKRAMSGAEFSRGYRPKPGDRMGTGLGLG